jgi:predicted secreted protein
MSQTAADPSVEFYHTTAIATAYTVDDCSTGASYGKTSSTVIEPVHLLLIAIGSVGTALNLFVLVTLLVVKEFRKNTANVFVGNQTVIYAVASFALTLTMIIQDTGTSNHAVGFNGRVLCWFFDNAGFIGVAMNASAVSLIVIALERYFRIVHPLKHRNNFRPWMVKLGVFAPWIDGLFVAIIPLGLTGDVVDGECRIGVEKSLARKPYYAFIFVWRDIVPLLIFILCFSHILKAVRRRNRIFVETTQSSNVTAGSSGQAENDTHAVKELSIRTTGGASLKEDNGQEHLGRAEKKVILTMLTATVCYILCWFPLDLFMIFSGHLPQNVVSTMNMALGGLTYMTVLLNAMVYSSRLGVFRRSWRAFRRLCSTLPVIKLE